MKKLILFQGDSITDAERSREYDYLYEPFNWH